MFISVVSGWYSHPVWRLAAFCVECIELALNRFVFHFWTLDVLFIVCEKFYFAVGKSWAISLCANDAEQKKHSNSRFNKCRGGSRIFFQEAGGALVSCSTSTPINHIVFFLQNTSCIRNCRSSQGWGVGVRTSCTLPLDPPLKWQSLTGKIYHQTPIDHQPSLMKIPYPMAHCQTKYITLLQCAWHWPIRSGCPETIILNCRYTKQLAPIALDHGFWKSVPQQLHQYSHKSARDLVSLEIQKIGNCICYPCF